MYLCWQDNSVRDSLLPPGVQTDGEVLQDQGGAQQVPHLGLRRGLQLGEVGQGNVMRLRVIALDILTSNVNCSVNNWKKFQN